MLTRLLVLTNQMTNHYGFFIVLLVPSGGVYITVRHHRLTAFCFFTQTNVTMSVCQHWIIYLNIITRFDWLNYVHKRHIETTSKNILFGFSQQEWKEESKITRKLENKKRRMKSRPAPLVQWHRTGLWVLPQTGLRGKGLKEGKWGCERPYWLLMGGWRPWMWGWGG